MKNKLLAIIVLLTIGSTKSFGQTNSSYTENLTKLTVWVSDIDSVIKRTGDGEKLKKISKQLSYVMETIQNVMEGEKNLAESVSKRSEINEELSTQLQALVIQVVGDIDQLSDHMKKVKTDVSEKDKVILEPIVASFNEISQNKDTIKLNYLTGYLYGMDNMEGKLKLETKHTASIAEKLLDKLAKAKEKIKAKYPR